MTPQSRNAPVTTVTGSQFSDRTDAVATEEPLEIRARTVSQDATQTIAITMRTPGNDAELATGFLWCEGLISDVHHVLNAESSGKLQPGGFQNIVTVTLSDAAMLDFAPDARRFYVSSSCGVCGKASLESVETATRFELSRGVPTWSPGVIHGLSAKLRAAQATFDTTGGLHAAGLFAPTGDLLTVREDVGRHNAVDKLVGEAIFRKALPLSETLLFVSGRASFELVQKAVMAGIPGLAAVGAPSSLAVSLAADAGLTLLGFVRGDRFNIYAGAERITRV